MNDEKGTLESLIEEKISADTDFQDSLVDMSEDEQTTAVEEKRKELIVSEYDSLKESSGKNKELADNYKIRAEKAEKAKKEDPTSKKEEETSKNKKDSDLSSKDLYALVEAKVPQEDVDEVIKAAKLLNKPIGEALQDDMVKIILEKRLEYRKTTKATNVGNKRSTSKTVSGDELLDKASKGEFPEKGSPEAEKLFWARRGGKR